MADRGQLPGLRNSAGREKDGRVRGSNVAMKKIQVKKVEKILATATMVEYA
jgi:hypothetical protein